MGDCLSASKLIDLTSIMFDCCCALVRGTFDGAVEGTKSAIMGTYHMVRHPIETVQSLGTIAFKIAELTHDYVPLYKPQFLCATEQERLSAQRYHDEIAQNWSQANKKLSHWWDETPTRDKIYEVTKGATHLITNIIIGNKCLDLIGKISKVAAIETVALYEKTNPQAIIAGTGIGIEMDATRELMLLSDAEKIVEAFAMIVLGKVEEYIIDNFAHNAAQYEKLKNALNEEQYTAIVKCTKHGLQRLMERFEPEELNAILTTPDFIKIQNDGATAFIKKFGEKYAIISMNPEKNEVVTGLNMLDTKSIINLGKNYGWTLS